jgi:CRISPR-associated protein Cas2
MVAYDVSSDRRRRKVAQALEDLGERVQKSVFVCDLRRRERAALRLRLRRWIDPVTDSLLLVDLGPAARSIESRIESMGHPVSRPTRVLVI